MANSLKRPICVLLILLIILSVFTVFPVVSAGAIADTTNPWIFAVNNGAVYNLDGKWVRYGDEDFQLTGSNTLVRFKKSATVYYLNYGEIHIAEYRTETNYRHFGTTVYVTGQGTAEHPYIFTPNMNFYRASVSSIANGATVAAGYENYDSLPNANQGVAVPGDGLRGASRILVGKGSNVEFAQHNGQYYQPDGNSEYIGVSEAGRYGWKISTTSIPTGYGFDFVSGNNTLYYLGVSDSGVYKFSENNVIRTSFSGTNKVICNVTWENQDGTTLKTLQYNLGEIADDGGLSPEKASDAAYEYTFTGFEPAYAPLTDDTTYVAAYEAEPINPLIYSVDAWIFPTDDGKVYDELDGMCYSYNGGPATGFTQGGSFSVVDNQIQLCGIVVADIDTSQPAYKTFANTVYVTGDGSPDDPFVFHPNYIYGDASKTYVKDGPAIAVPGVNALSGDKGTANPGDGFKAMSKIRVGNNQVQFLQQYGNYTASRNLLGVGETTYGYRYSKTKAMPFNFVSEDHTLYYFEKTSGDIYQFSETKPPLRNTFYPSSSTIYTVTWKDDDGTVLDTESYYVGVMPTYKGENPSKEATQLSRFTFNDWSPSISPVTGDATYTATYTETPKLFPLHSLTLNGDIGVNFFLNVTPAQINTGEGVVVNFSYDVDGKTKTSSYKLNTSEFITYEGKDYYKATCWVAAAEMTYDIHATATINGTLQDETDDYSVRDYADVILSPSYATAHPVNYEELAFLVKAMLDYGAKAQVVFNRRTDDLANNGIDYSMVDVSASTISSSGRSMDADLSKFGLEYYNTSVIFLSKTTLRHYYYVTDRNKFDAVKSSITFSGNGADGVCVDKDYYVYFDITDIAAADFDAVYTLRFDADHSYGFSVLDYASYIVENNKDNNQKELGKATYWYNDYANTYFALVNYNG